MEDHLLLFIAAALTIIWGAAHLFPTKSVVNDFGDISVDNRRIITMEWITEGVALIFIGALVGAVSIVDSTHKVSKVVYGLAVGGLLTLAMVSLFTGFRVRFLPFRLCPFIFAASAALILIGGLL